MSYFSLSVLLPVPNCLNSFISTKILDGWVISYFFLLVLLPVPNWDSGSVPVYGVGIGDVVHWKQSVSVMNL
jgi:hypothetical protein